MTAVKQAACSKAAVRRHQTACHPDEFWTTHGMTHVMAPDKRRQRLASGIDLHASEIRQLMYGRNGRHDMLLSQQD